MPFDMPFERLFDGQPLISPRGDGWESGVTFNSAAVYLDVVEQNLPTLRALLGPDEPLRDIVALHYRARPALEPGFPWTRSSVGLAIYEPDLTLIRRFDYPVIRPGETPDIEDYQGVEDPRITWLDGAWWMVYCGVMPIQHPDPMHAWRGSICMARSTDLIHWEKLGSVTGCMPAFGHRNGPETVTNKDGVLFPDRIQGKSVLLHRPMIGELGRWCIHVATAIDITGPYKDLGVVHEAVQAPEYLRSWVGAGAVPITIGPGRYLSIEHTGNFYENYRSKYVLDAVLYDFNNWDPEHPETLVAARMDDIMRPQTDFEIKGPFKDSVANVVFTCGAYVHDEWLYVIYGGGDSYILAARIHFKVLVDALLERELQGA